MRKLNSYLLSLAGLALLVITLLANFQIIMRYIFELPFPWVEEVLRYILVYVVFLSSAIAIFNNSHLKVDMLDTLLSGKPHRYLESFRNLLIALFSSIFAYVSYQYISNIIAGGQTSTVLGISMGWPMSALLIGSIFMIINAIYVSYSDIKAARKM